MATSFGEYLAVLGVLGEPDALAGVLGGGPCDDDVLGGTGPSVWSSPWGTSIGTRPSLCLSGGAAPDDNGPDPKTPAYTPPGFNFGLDACAIACARTAAW